MSRMLPYPATAGALLLLACSAPTPPTALTAAAGPPVTQPGPRTASLSGTWIGNRPQDGLLLEFAACGACAPPSRAVDVVVHMSDSDGALSGIATLTIREAPSAGCLAEPGCSPPAVGEVLTASVTGSVSAGGAVSMRWAAAPVTLDLQGAVFANRMSGTVVPADTSAPGGAAGGTWSITLR